MPPTLFRQIPTDTPGLQWTGLNLDEMREFLGDDYAGWRGNSTDGMLLLIRTMEHDNEPFAAPPGSWVMQGTKGEHWAVAADVFPERYEPVDRSSDLIADSEQQGVEAHAELRRAEQIENDGQEQQ